MYLLKVVKKDYFVYSYTKPGRIIKCSEDEVNKMYELEDLQNAKRIKNKIVAIKELSSNDIFIMYKVYNKNRYCIVRGTKDGISTTMDVTFDRLYEYDTTENILNAKLKDGEYRGIEIVIPEYDFESGKIKTAYDEVYKRFLLRAYDLYCIYSVSGKSSRSPVPYGKLDTEAWHWVRQRMKTFHTAEYNDWMRLLSVTL